MGMLKLVVAKQIVKNANLKVLLMAPGLRYCRHLKLVCSEFLF